MRAVKSLLLFAAVMFACAPASARAQEKKGDSPLRVKASMPGVAVSFSPVELGQQKGIYRDEGIELEMIVMRANVALAALVTDEIDYIIGLGSPTRAAAKGIPIKLVAAVDTRPVWFLVTRPEIKTVADLKGKRLGVGSLKGSIQLAAAMALEQRGIPTKDIAWLSVGATPARLQAMESKAIDAAIVALPGNLTARKMGFRELIDVGEVASTPTVGLVVSDKKLAQKPHDVQRMIRATIKSTRYFLTHKKEAAEFIAKRFNFSSDQAALVYDQQVPALTADGVINEKGILLDLQFAQEAGEKFGDAPLAKVIDLRPLQEIQKELGKFRN
jgi:NitT/TauT family transport system substrate-binding protein